MLSGRPIRLAVASLILAMLTLLGAASASAAVERLAAPLGVSATRGTIPGAVRLTWLPVRGAATYRIYGTPPGRLDAQLLAQNITGTVADVPARVFSEVFYVVVAVSPDGLASLPSSGSVGFPAFAGPQAGAPVVPPPVAGATAGGPRAFAFQLRVANTDRFGRSGQVVVSPHVTSLSQGDTVQGFTYYVNGREVGRNPGTGKIMLEIGGPGAYAITAVGTTALGETAQAQAGTDVLAGGPPKCEIDETMGPTGGITLRARCSVERGTIVRYRWEVNDSVSNVAGRVLNFRPNEARKVRAVILTVTTDEGMEATATYTPSVLPRRDRETLIPLPPKES